LGGREQAQHRHRHREEPCPQHPRETRAAQSSGSSRSCSDSSTGSKLGSRFSFLPRVHRRRRPYSAERLAPSLVFPQGNRVSVTGIIAGAAPASCRRNSLKRASPFFALWRDTFPP
jgi:hypothetical protein